MRRTIKSALAALVLSLALRAAAPVAAGALEDGLAAYDRHDYATAMRLWRPLAEQGSAIAQSNIALMYDSGLGVPWDHAEAVKWFRKAADRGEANAQFNLGNMYRNGRGVPWDFVEAHKWFDLAATRFPASKTYNRRAAVNKRDLAALDMTPEQIAEAQRLAREWKPK